MALYRRSTLSLLFTLVVACDPEFTSKPCPAGQVPDNGAGVCRPCEAGAVPDLKTGQCKACEAGFAPDASGQCAPSTQNPAGSGGSGGGSGAGGTGGQAGTMPGGSGGGSGSAGGIGGSGGAPVDSGTAHLRIVHLSPDAGDLKLCTRTRALGPSAPFDQVLLPRFAYANMSAYLDVPATPLDYRLVPATDSCEATGVAPDNSSLEPMLRDQYATLVVAGVRNPAVYGGVPAGQALALHLLLDPEPFVGNEQVVEARLSSFAIKSPPVDMGVHSNIGRPEEEFFVMWAPTQYGVVSVSSPPDFGRPYGFRLYGSEGYNDETMGFSLSPANPSRPSLLMTSGPQYFGPYDTARVNLFFAGVYSGNTNSIELIACVDKKPTEPPFCQKATFSPPS